MCSVPDSTQDIVHAVVEGVSSIGYGSPYSVLSSTATPLNQVVHSAVNTCAPSVEKVVGAVVIPISSSLKCRVKTAMFSVSRTGYIGIQPSMGPISVPGQPTKYPIVQAVGVTGNDNIIPYLSCCAGGIE